MSRYLILILLNLPLIVAGIVNSVVNYKLKHRNRPKLIIRLGFWALILAGLVFAEPIYNYLFSNNLTATEALSLFDVIQITGIILTFFIANKAYGKADLLEKRMQNLHQEISIKLSEK